MQLEIKNNYTDEDLHYSTEIVRDRPLAKLNWFNTGGSAELYSEPTSEQDFKNLIKFCNSKNLRLTILGSGANILISDDGIEGLVVKPNIKSLSTKKLSRNEVLVTAGAGLSIAKLIEFCLDEQFIGMEEFSGIPGTIGGAVYINLHYFSHLLSDFLVEARVIDRKNGDIHSVDKSWFNFSYNYSKLHKETHYVIDATFKLKIVSETEASYSRGRAAEIIRHRHNKYPQARTCGSFFRNFNEDEVSVISNGKKMIYVAYYLDKLGIKGELKHGNAQVSYKHANMIVTDSGATTHDVIQVARSMQKLVFNSYRIIPQPECQLLGFSQYPLLN